MPLASKQHRPLQDCFISVATGSACRPLCWQGTLSKNSGCDDGKRRNKRIEMIDYRIGTKVRRGNIAIAKTRYNHRQTCCARRTDIHMRIANE